MLIVSQRASLMVGLTNGIHMNCGYFARAGLKCSVSATSGSCLTLFRFRHMYLRNVANLRIVPQTGRREPVGPRLEAGGWSLSHVLRCVLASAVLLCIP